MKLSLAIGALTWYPLSASLRIARSAGFDGVELLASPWLLARGPERVERLASTIGVPVLSVHTPLRFRSVDSIALADDAGRTLEFAAVLPHCRVVTVHHPITPNGGQADLARWLARLQHHRERTGIDHVTLSVENRPHNNDSTPIQTLDDPTIMRSVATEWGLGITLDVAHAASMELPLGNLLREWLPHVNNVHLSDAKEQQLHGGLRNGLFRDHQLPGAGILPIADIVSYLESTGYDGPITLELNPLTVGAWIPPLVVRRLKRSVEELRAHMRTEHADLQTSQSPTRPTRRR